MTGNETTFDLPLNLYSPALSITFSRDAIGIAVIVLFSAVSLSPLKVLVGTSGNGVIDKYGRPIPTLKPDLAVLSVVRCELAEVVSVAALVVLDANESVDLLI